MIRVTCPHCGSKLNAKDDLIGQMRKCPKCAQPLIVVADRPPPAGETAVPPGPDNPPERPAVRKNLCRPSTCPSISVGRATT